MQQAGAMNPAAAAAAPVAVQWTAPAGWETQPASGFRKGSFVVHGPDGKTADVSVISFPEQAGGLLANVNRWRNQLKLAPVTNEVEAGMPMAVAGRDMYFVDLVSEQRLQPDGAKTRILGGIFPLPGETWFFKMMGPAELVEAQRDAFKQFLNSVHLGGADRRCRRWRRTTTREARTRRRRRRSSRRRARRCSLPRRRAGRRSRSRRCGSRVSTAPGPDGKRRTSRSCRCPAWRAAISRM